MQYEGVISCIKTNLEIFDAIGYAGIGRSGLARVLASFESGDNERAIVEYRLVIGHAPNFASALTDFDLMSYPVDMRMKLFNGLLGVMSQMSLVMDGKAR